jgi:hypothetical protein
MEREELLQQVTENIEADGKQLSPSLSEESINGELDDALEDIGEDEEANKKLIAKLAKRLLRMDGNIHSNVSREVKEYKKKASAPVQAQDTKGAETNDDETPSWAKALLARVDAIEESRKAKEVTDAKDAAVAAVKKGLRAAFKSAEVEVNEYIYKQTLRDLEIPEVEEGEEVNVDSLVKKMERAYYRNLKEAGLDKKDTGKSRFGSREGSSSESAADRFFAKKGKKEGWRK